ncbi:MAG TPA: C4-type zinc ribbon domain-containing protein [Bacteroidota bacterium]|nr:C4-type zinc ribbon domain-containing protein [Bacteroidota bacterium]
METRLRMLYELQKIDSQLDELEELRGNLPETIALLEVKMNDAKNKVKELDDTIKSTLAKRTQIDEEIAILKAKNEKSKQQLYNVKNNKEYDALMTGIDQTDMKILELEEEMDKLADLQKKKREEFEEADKAFNSIKKEYEEKSKQLNEIIKTTEKEELELNHQREKTVVRINRKDLQLYTKIRNAKKIAVAPIKRNACSGCYNIVPPQKIVELRKYDKIHTCEFCGRILISDELTSE